MYKYVPTNNGVPANISQAMVNRAIEASRLASGVEKDLRLFDASGDTVDSRTKVFNGSHHTLEIFRAVPHKGGRRFGDIAVNDDRIGFAGFYAFIIQIDGEVSAIEFFHMTTHIRIATPKAESAIRWQDVNVSSKVPVRIMTDEKGKHDPENFTVIADDIFKVASQYMALVMFDDLKRI